MTSSPPGPNGAPGAAPPVPAPGRPALPRRLARAAFLSAASYGRHGSPQLAAAIAFRALFALVPLLALAVSLAQLVLPDGASEDLREWLGGLAPGGELEPRLARALDQTGTAAGLASVVALAGLLWTASGLAASLRVTLRVVWEAPAGRPFLRGKLADLLIVVAAVALVLAAVVAGVAVQLVTRLGSTVADGLGVDGVDAGLLGTLGQTAVSLALGVVALLVVFRFLAPEPRPFAELLPGAVLGAVLAQVVVLGFSTYLALVDVDELYGALGGIFGLLLLAYFVGQAVVFGAEVTAAWPATLAPSGPVPAAAWIGVLRRLLRREAAPVPPADPAEPRSS